MFGEFKFLNLMVNLNDMKKLFVLFFSCNLFLFSCQKAPKQLDENNLSKLKACFDTTLPAGTSASKNSDGSMDITLLAGKYS